MRLFNDCSQFHSLYSVEYSSDSEIISVGGMWKKQPLLLLWYISTFARRI
jgi:hypothetical protein